MSFTLTAGTILAAFYNSNAMNASLRTLLVLLRLAIGWHLLVEGYVKLHSIWTGPTDSKQPFTSRSYLQQSHGPFSGFFKWLAGDDPDDLLVQRLTLEGEGEQPRLSRPMRTYWEQYLENFVRTYQVEGKDVLELRKKLEEHAIQLIGWIRRGEEQWEMPTDWGPVRRKQKVKAWLDEYVRTLSELRELEGRERQYFEHPVGIERANRLRRQVAWYRGQFTTALNSRTQDLLRAWREILPPEKRSTGSAVTIPEPVTDPVWLGRPVIWWVDRATAWGLTISGLLLLFGLWSRLGAWLGALLVLMFYLCQPPLPWVPIPERAEGYYLYVNKNLIEALALAVLGVVPSGRWFGLDGLIHAIFGKRTNQTAAVTSAGTATPPAQERTPG
jgi:uncharacterized membrane protein YphA (DoxX/SURF4 family)